MADNELRPSCPWQLVALDTGNKGYPLSRCKDPSASLCVRGGLRQISARGETESD
ncbi:hypothetical protein BCR44DRAFT_1455470 [Catenaria anguillulae PL171]|uniref:Uncharacterized protein n=1 Tax=Catenaria anguillulae PL171 TaxID=765915 RepID=A0A1Y2H0I9_9FUNG|nr:hypothetical protein BCR44DRAFT_1455470 [Catenaria anguillulae PL171]